MRAEITLGGISKNFLAMISPLLLQNQSIFARMLVMQMLSVKRLRTKLIHKNVH